MEKKLRRGDIEIHLSDYNEDVYNQTLDVEKELYSEDDLINCEDAIRLMVDFLRMMTFGDMTIIEALEQNTKSLKDNAFVITNWKDERYEVCE